jgi:hypothetical protein
MLLAKDTAFVGRLAYGHSFDRDELGIHGPLPPTSTTFVALEPTTRSRLPIYCGVPGQRDAGMVGTITLP